MPEARPSENPGAASVRRSAPDLVEVIFEGSITGTHMQMLVEQLRAEFAKGTPSFALLDGSQVSHYSADVRGPGVAMVELLRHSGVVRAIGVVPGAPIRMMASTLAFVGRLPSDFCETRAEALEKLQEHRERLAARSR